MKTVMLILMTASLLVAMVSCGAGSSRVSSRLAEAERAMAANDMDAAMHLCRDLNDCKSNTEFSVSELGRLSILYMQISDRTDDTDNVDYAVGCYREAFELNADSARAFYASLPRDDDKYVMMLSAIAGSLDNPPSLTDEEPDSINMIF